MSGTHFDNKAVVVILVVFTALSMTPLASSVAEQQGVSTESWHGTSIQHAPIGRNQGQPPALTGLAPHTKRAPTPLTTGKVQHALPGGRGEFYAYNVYDWTWTIPQGPVTFDNDATIYSLQGTWIDFISGSDFDYNNNWYGVGYYGGLYQIDPYNGDMTFIANTIPWCTSLVIDKTTSTWYVSDPYGLYTIDIETGETTLVGLYQITTYIISLMVDDYGHMYGYDVVGAGNSTLYHINKSTGLATPIGDMGHGYCYAQEGKFDRLTNTLYLATYGAGSYLATCDPATGHVTFINDFSPDWIEIDGLTIPWNWLIPGVGVNEITAPVSGNASVITPEVTIRNHGWYDIDNVPVNMTIMKNQYTNHMNEPFNESVFPPCGWSNLATTDYWVQSPTNYAGGAAPEAVLWSYNNYGGTGGLKSAYVDTSSASSLTLSFRSYIEWWGGPCTCTVEVTGDGGATWHDLSPWANPLEMYQLAWQFTINISAYIGTQTGVRFTYSGQYNWINFWAIDDVRLFTREHIPEYNQTIYTDIPAWTAVHIIFPAWTPADLSVYESCTVEYVVNATTRFQGNYFPYDYQQKIFTLYYGYFHDVAITAITSPQSGLAATQPVQVALANNGQNNEYVNVNVIIGKVSYNNLLTEDFSGGVPPAGWGTDDPTHWMSSNTNYAGGTAPEAMFYYLNSETRDFHLYTGTIDTTGWTTAQLKYKEYVNDYNSQYTLKIQTSTDGGVTWSDAYTRTGGPYGPQTTQITLGTVNGVGSNNLMISFTYSGNSYNINYWYIDDVWFGQINFDTEYNQTANVCITTGASTNITLPDWTPADVPLAAGIDYLIDASVSMNVSDGNPVDNELTKLITLSYEHDVGVIEITEPASSLVPGTYPTAGIIENLGATYQESFIPVEAKITHVGNNTVIYDQTTTLAGPLAPGETATVTFPDFTLLNLTAWEGTYKVEIWTALPNDDHPDNDKTSMTFTMAIPDVIPPITNHTLTGTMGKNGWYVSDVVVTLSVYDPIPPVKFGHKQPSAVNHTYYKLHAADPWTEYISDFNVDTDGFYELFYYSVDKADNTETEKGPFAFKIDKTAPVFVNFSATPENAMKNKWLLSAELSDPASGVDHVEFYVDDQFVGTVNATPWEFHYQGNGKMAQAIAYDNAGNSAISHRINEYQPNVDSRSISIPNAMQNDRLSFQQILQQR